ncbi:restriction endonuclease subunit S [Pedobacter panaciterrae]|uniref:restriction endonuclease subunit S n=1 Tax=Pedobacter panaciterrae TaxID=363849 RepID=UPI00155DCF23|nr:restriction endonuclease subunit S [Pedobacter panaciterrae]NQX56869.1 restriction endonuclease subunit S [Pedobacter panaciterrae]
MKRYDNYKDSGIEWIGEIPEHWDVRPLKHLSKITLGKMLTPEDKGGYTLKPYLRSQNIQINQVDISDVKEMWFSENELGKYRLKKGDILVNEGGDIGRTCIWNSEIDECYIQNSVNRVQMVLGNNHYYLYHFYLHHQLRYFDSIVNRVSIPHLTKEKLENVSFVTPLLVEQIQIAKYLAQKTTQIDKLIADKEKLIELLNEERTAIINQAITKGLNLNVPMKDSGVEWLGEIPEHWEIKRMKYLCEIGTGGKDTENREVDGAYPFYVRSQTVERISSYSFDGEAILTAGDGVGVCKVWHYVNEKFDYHQRVYRMSDFKDVKGKFLFLYLKENFEKEVMKLSAKSTVDSLRRPMFQNFPVAYPAELEQNKIIGYLDSEELRIQNLLMTIQQEIDLLKEYKTALISEVVTGKVDVRDEVICGREAELVSTSVVQ